MSLASFDRFSILPSTSRSVWRLVATVTRIGHQLSSITVPKTTFEANSCTVFPTREILQF